MAQITAEMVRELREITGAGMMDCKKALTQSSNMEAAINFLREKGLAAAAKKAGRVASEGLVSIFADKKSVGMVELNCETDFVARGAEFNQLASALAKHVTEGGLSVSLSGKVLPGDDLLKQNFCDDSAVTIEQMINAKIALIGEKIDLRRSVLFAGGDIYGTYTHSGGSIGAVVELVGKDIAKDKLVIVEDLARDLAMHVAATAPLALTKDGVDEKVVANEKIIFTNQVLEQNKPANIAEKIVAGKLDKFFKEVCLLDQKFVKDPDISISELVNKTSKNIGVNLELTSFARFKVGEGITKKTDDLATEVAKMVQ